MRLIPILFTTVSIALTPAAFAQQVNSGAYLAARQAGINSDFAAAADYFARALVRDSANETLIESAMTSFLSLGDVQRALPLADRLVERDPNHQLANLTLMAEWANTGAWDQILATLETGEKVGPLYDGLMRAWALVGLGQMSDALEQFDTVTETRGTQAFGLYHRALALASVGDFEGAATVFSGENGARLGLTRSGIVANAQVLGQIGRADEAIALIDAARNADRDPSLSGLRARLASGDPEE